MNDRLAAALEGRYRIERELGAGGMATVYLAGDLKHDRKVAVKVLKPELTAVLGADRFIQEIKTTASLQHPHILPLFDSGTADGFLFYVMPYIEGETLREKLDRETQLGIDEAVRITREVADALDYAHRNGIIHRDIKPENILLHDGRPMVADFGIALAVSAAAGGRMTETGTSVGTPHYMSPEQATGDKQITGRADIYSLASVLYEMLSGEPPHMGNSAQAVIMKIIAEPVQPVTKLRKSVPPNVAAAVMKALEKLPADRFESAKAFADALADPNFTTTSMAAAGHGPATVGAWIRNPFSGALPLLLLILAAGLSWSLGRPAPERPVSRFEITVPSGRFYPPAELSRDGRRIVSRAGDSVYIRDLDDLTPRVLNLPGGPPRLSWDGREVAYSAGHASSPALINFFSSDKGLLNVVSVDGGTPTTLLDSINLGSYRWGDDGRIYVVRNGVLGRVPATGGAFEPLLHLDTLALGRPLRARLDGFDIDVAYGVKIDDVLPGGRAVLVSGPRGLHAVPLDGREPRLLAERAALGRVLPGGYLAWVQRGRAMISKFDPESLNPAGEPLLIADTLPGSRASMSWSDEGTVLYNPGTLPQVAVFANRDGTIRIVPGMDDSSPYVSPDGSRLAVARRTGPGTQLYADNIWLQDPIGSAMRPLTFARDSLWRGVAGWSADGSRVYFTAAGVLDSDSANGTHLMVVEADNPGEPDTVLTLPQGVLYATVAPDGRTAVWVPSGLDLVARRTIWSATLGSGVVREVLTVPAGQVQDQFPRVSPDGAWIVYTSTEAGWSAVYAQAYPTGGRKLQVSSDSGRAPFWSRSGRSIFFSRQGQLWEARFDATAGRVTDRAAILDLPIRVQDALPGDREFIGTTVDLMPGQPARFVLVQGMLAEVERRMRGQR